MKIKTNRCWDIELKGDMETGVIDVIEHHHDSDPRDHNPHVVIPVEIIDVLILRLIEFKLKTKRRKT